MEEIILPALTGRGSELYDCRVFHIENDSYIILVHVSLILVINITQGLHADIFLRAGSFYYFFSRMTWASKMHCNIQF